MKKAERPGFSWYTLTVVLLLHTVRRTIAHGFQPVLVDCNFFVFLKRETRAVFHVVLLVLVDCSLIVTECGENCVSCCSAGAC